VIHFGAQVATIMSLGATQCMVLVPAGLAPGPTWVKLTAQGFTSESASFTVLAGRPRILSVEPGGGAPGTPVVVRVAECDPIDGLILLFGQTPVQVLSRDAQGLLTVVPANLTSGLIDLTVADGQGVSAPFPFMVSSGKPTSLVVLDSVSPSWANTGQLVTIRGQGFGLAPTDNVVFFGETEVLPLSGTNDQVQVVVPSGLASGPTYVLVSVHDYPSNPLAFTVGPVDARPALRVQLQGLNVQLSWAQSASDFRLERTASLSSPLTWNSVDATPILIGDQYTVTVKTTDGTQFYRLKRP
jgi:hypothetical protein